MNLIRRIFFSLFYLRQPPWDTGVSPPELMAFINSHPPGRALDLGCGTGTNAITLALHGWQVEGVDFVNRAIRSARRKARQAGVSITFHNEDVTRLQGIEPAFDLILDIGCYHNLPPGGKERYLEHVQRLLALNGFFLIYALRCKPETGGGGLEETDIEKLADAFRLVERKDGVDRGSRLSTWITFQRR